MIFRRANHRFRTALLLASALGLTTLAGAGTAWATPTVNLALSLQNPSFESGTGLACPSGWTCGGTAPGAAAETINSSQYNAVTGDGLSGGAIVPYGTNAAILPAYGSNNTGEPIGGAGSGSLMQTDIGTYVTGDDYVLDFWLGFPDTEGNLDIPGDSTTYPVANYPDTVTVTLLDNGVTGSLCDQNTATLTNLTGAFYSASSGNGIGAAPACVLSIPDPGQGYWQEFQLTYDAVSNASGNIGIEFSAASANGSIGQPKEVNIDIDPVAIPEPATLGLFGAGLVALGFVGRRRRRVRSS